MAKLINLETLEEVYLLPEHLFGRHMERCHTYINHPKISRIHASIIWNNQMWCIKDSSSNGTLINGKRVESELKIPLSVGDQLQFVDVTQKGWKILDCSPPTHMLIPLSPSLPTIKLDKLLALPSEEQPLVLLYLNSQEEWMCESTKETTSLKDGSLVVIDPQHIWRFKDATPSTETVKETRVSSLFLTPLPQLTFEVSLNEEHVCIYLSSPGTQTFDLGERVHHQLLLELARKRLDDQKLGLSEQDLGWIDRGLIAIMLGIDDNYLTQQFYRARKQLEKYEKQFPNIQSILASRPNEIRLDHNFIQIKGGLIKQPS